MIPNFYRPNKVQLDTNGIICGACAIVNALFAAYMLFFLFGRMLDMGGKLGFLGIALLIILILANVVLLGVALACAITALVGIKLPITYAHLQMAGYASAGVSGLSLVFDVVIMFLLGNQDPSGLVWNMFMMASILSLLQTATAVAFVMFLPPYTNFFPMMPFELMPQNTISYAPIPQNQPMMIPMTNF